MYEGVTHFVAQLHGTLVSIVVDTLYQADVCTQVPGGFHLADGSSFGETDERLDAAVCGSQCDSLCMVASRACDDALCLFFVGQL